MIWFLSKHFLQLPENKYIACDEYILGTLSASELPTVSPVSLGSVKNEIKELYEVKELYEDLNGSNLLLNGIKLEQLLEDESNSQDSSINEELQEFDPVSGVDQLGIKLNQEQRMDETNSDETLQIHCTKVEKSRNENECTAVQQGILCQCPLCNINNKVSSNKSVDKPYACKLCDFRFIYKSRLKYHMKTHEDLKLFPCNTCVKSFTSSFSLKEHQLRQHYSGPNPYKMKCHICFNEFSGKSSLTKHIRSIHLHTYRKKNFPCSHCSKTLADSKSFARHVAVHLKKSELICDLCGYVCYTKSTLINHMRSRHLNQGPAKCDVCGQVTNNSQALRIHKDKKHSGKVFNCEMCGEIFNTKSILQKHLVAHVDERPFVCQTCGKTFKREHNLDQHQFSHSSDRPYICDICGQSFRLKTHVKQHLAVHGIGNNHKCLICNTFFARKTELNLHKSVHYVPS